MSNQPMKDSHWESASGRWPTTAWPAGGGVNAEVCVVGAGISGLLTAYELQRRGKQTVVVEGRSPGAGDTGMTTAHLTAFIDMRYVDIEKKHGAATASVVAESHSAALALIEEIAQREKIECNFSRLDGYLAVLEKTESTLNLQEEMECARRGGVSVVELQRECPYGVGFSKCLRVSDQALFNPMDFLHGVADAFVSQGGRIFTGRSVMKITGGEDPHVEVDGGMMVHAGAVVVATNSPISDRVAMHTKQAAYRTYVVGFVRPADEADGFLLWDTEDPYHYVRPAEVDGQRLLLVGGGDHRTGMEDDGAKRLEELEAWGRRHFPQVGAVTHKWSGQVLEPVDGLAFIGADVEGGGNVYIITGASGNGMTYAGIAALMLPDLIAGRPHLWSKTYSPSRKMVKAAAEFIEENAATMAHLVGDWVSGSEIDDAAKLKPGEGALMRDGLKKVTIHRDSEGHLHTRSAVCPHLGCIVRWNSWEQSWDCPCHGSRFDGVGETVLNAPAIGGLTEIEKPIDKD